MDHLLCAGGLNVKAGYGSFVVCGGLNVKAGYGSFVVCEGT